MLGALDGMFLAAIDTSKQDNSSRQCRKTRVQRIEVDMFLFERNELKFENRFEN